MSSISTSIDSWASAIFISLPHLIGLLDTASDIDVFEDSAQDAVHGNAPSIGRAEDDPFVLVEGLAVEPSAALVLESVVAHFDDQPDLGLVPILGNSVVRQENAALGLGGADIYGAKDLVVENLDNVN